MKTFNNDLRKLKGHLNNKDIPSIRLMFDNYSPDYMDKLIKKLDPWEMKIYNDLKGETVDEMIQRLKKEKEERDVLIFIQ